MPHPRAVLPLVLITLAACTDTTVKVYNTAPTVSITSPEDGSIYQPGTLVEVYGLTRDSQQDPSTLLVTLSSSLDGELGTITPDSEGITYTALSTLSAGLHALTMTAFDDAGESGQATVSVEMSYGGQVVGAPELILIGPANDTKYGANDSIIMVATATDDEQPWETLFASVVSDQNGLIWEGYPASNGAITAELPWPLLEGYHTLTMTIEDDDGNIDDATVLIEILPDGRPTVEILSPKTGSKTLTTATTLLEGVVVDDVSDPDSMTCTWASNLMGTLASGSPDSSGYCGAGITFTEGTHVITLLAMDEEGNEGSATVNLIVTDPLNTDDDFDGMTENGGDCNDADSTIYYGAPEACDAKDNDCDGLVNETFTDTYDSGSSSNNAISSAYSLADRRPSERDAKPTSASRRSPTDPQTSSRLGGLARDQQRRTDHRPLVEPIGADTRAGRAKPRSRQELGEDPHVEDMQTVALRSGTQSPPLRRGDRRPTRRPLRGLAAWRETNNAAPTTARSSSRSAPTPGQVAQSREGAKSSAKTPTSRTCRPSPLERDAKPTSASRRSPTDPQTSSRLGEDLGPGTR
jgi:hypothetical protein